MGLAALVLAVLLTAGTLTMTPSMANEDNGFTERSLEGEGVQARGAARMPPDHVAERARELGLKQEAWLIAYCT